MNDVITMTRDELLSAMESPETMPHRLSVVMLDHKDAAHMALKLSDLNDHEFTCMVDDGNVLTAVGRMRSRDAIAFPNDWVVPAL